MASGFEVNIVINAGVDFYQEFVLTNPDLSLKDITGHKFAGGISKHRRSIDVEISTNEKLKYNIQKFTTGVASGVEGRYYISMSAEQTNKLKEGKYVYNVVMTDLNGLRSSVMDGLAFVDVAFGLNEP